MSKSAKKRLGALRNAAPAFRVELRPIDVREAGEIERAIWAFAQTANGGLIVSGSAASVIHRDLIVALAAWHDLPAVYSQRFFVIGGGLVSYGPDRVDQHRRAAGYVEKRFSPAGSC